MSSVTLFDLARIFKTPASARRIERRDMAMELIWCRVEARISEHGPCSSAVCLLWRGHETEWEHCADLARLADAWRAT